MSFLINFILLLSTLFLWSCQFDIAVEATSNDVKLNSKPQLLTNSTSATFAFSTNDKAATFKCSIDGSAFQTCSSPLSYSALSESLHTFKVVALDKKLKESKETTYAWTVDTTNPTLTVSTFPANPNNHSSANFVYSGSDLNGIRTYECSLNSGTFQACSSNVPVIALTTGSHTYEIRAVDRAGNTSAVYSYTWLVDLIAPTVSLTANPDAATIATTATFSFTGADSGGSNFLKFECRLDAGTYSDCVTGQNYTSLAGGTHNFYLRGLDGAGNYSAVTTYQWIVDTTDPVLASFTIAEGALSVGLPLTSTQTTITAGGSPVTEVRFSEDNSFTGATWLPYTSDNTFMLTNLNGPKTVYAQVRSASGRLSNILSASTDLQSGILPITTITAPTAASTYAGGQAMTIEWSCEAGAGSTLAATPISQIQYTVDDGLSWFNIASNLTNNQSATTGSYTWNIPNASPTGVAITSTTPIRVSVFCRSSAGVVINSLSPILNSQWSVLVGEPGNLNEGVHINAVDMSNTGVSNQAFHSDSKGSLFYSRLHAILYIDVKTGVATRFVGDPYSETCNLATAQFIYPEILGVTENDEVIIYSRDCSALAKIRISNKSVVWTKQLPTILYNDEYGISQRRSAMYSPEGYFTYYSDNSIFLQDLNNITSAPVRVIGASGSCAALVVGQMANTQALPCKDNTKPEENFGVVTNADVSKIWIRRSGKTFELGKDLSGNYVVNSDDIAAWNAFPFDSCSFMKRDTHKVYCRGQIGAGNKLAVLDTTNSTWPIVYTLAAHYKAISSNLYFGDGGDALLTYSQNTNELYRLTENGTTFTPSKIGGTPFLSYGNGSSGNAIAFTAISGMGYDHLNNYLYVKGPRHIRRMSVDPITKDISAVTTGYLSTIGNSSAYGALTISKNGQRAALVQLGGIFKNLLTAYDLTTVNPVNETVVRATNYYGGTATVWAAYPALGVPFASHTGTLPILNSVRKTSTFLPDGKLYWAAAEDEANTQNYYIYQATATTTATTVSIAGATGAAGYSTNGNVALGAGIQDVAGLGADANGDLLIFDGPRLRRITVATDTSPIKIYDEIDFSTFTNYPNLKWTHAVYDPATEWSYFVITADQNINREAQIWAANKTNAEFIRISTAGLNLPVENANWQAMSLEVTPIGLLLLDTVKNRVLVTPLFP